MERARTGQVGPMADETGFREALGIRVDGDGQRAVLDADQRHLNPHGTVHGGVLASLADMVMASAVAAAGDEAERAVTVSLTMTYLRPAQPGRLTAHAELGTRGEHLSIVEADVVQEESGKTVAHAVGTFAIRS